MRLFEAHQEGFRHNSEHDGQAFHGQQTDQNALEDGPYDVGNNVRKCSENSQGKENNVEENRNKCAGSNATP